MKKKCKSYFGDYKCHVPTKLKDNQGRTIYVDKCLKEAVENLNDMGLKTVASCCGHGIINSSIQIEGLEDSKNFYFKDELIKLMLKYEEVKCFIDRDDYGSLADDIIHLINFNVTKQNGR